MPSIKPQLHLLSIWRVRLLLCAFLPSFFSAYFIDRQGVLWWIFSALWVLLFLYFYIIYYPIKLRKLCYSGNDAYLLIHCGVIYTRIKAIPYSSIQYLSIASTPLERFFGICSLHLTMAGATASMPGLTRQQAHELHEALMPHDGGDSEC